MRPIHSTFGNSGLLPDLSHCGAPYFWVKGIRSWQEGDWELEDYQVSTLQITTRNLVNKPQWMYQTPCSEATAGQKQETAHCFRGGTAEQGSCDLVSNYRDYSVYTSVVSGAPPRLRTDWDWGILLYATLGVMSAAKQGSWKEPCSCLSEQPKY